MNKSRYKNDVYVELNHLKNEVDFYEVKVKQLKDDIKRFIVLLIENDIPIPEDLINSYIPKAKKSKSLIPFDDDLPF